jgi:hypothetical protein
MSAFIKTGHSDAKRMMKTKGNLRPEGNPEFDSGKSDDSMRFPFVATDCKIGPWVLDH